ncbi:MAG: phosphatase PAP2 family protein [Solirubrobacterales bacterium]
MKPRAFWKPLDDFESPALDWVKRVRVRGSVEDATAVLTKAGEHGMVWYGMAGVAAIADRQRRAEWLRAGAAVAVVYGANTALKFAARRKRPRQSEFGTETDLSFPSSHAVTSFAAARLFGELAPAARGPLHVGAFAVAFSRLHFMVHYPSDLLAGAAIGNIAGGAVAKRYFRRVNTQTQTAEVS